MTQGADSAGLSRPVARGLRSRPRPVARVGVVAGCLAMLVLAGCADPEVPPSPAPTAVATADPDPTPTAPARALQEPEQPGSWWQTDEAAAVDAARYFFSLYDYATRSGDLETWNRQSGQTCEFCANVSDGVSSDFADGGKVVGGELTVSNLRTVAFAEEIEVYGVEAEFELAASSRLDGAGTVTAEHEREEGYLVLDVAASARGWVLMEGSLQDGPVQ